MKEDHPQSYLPYGVYWEQDSDAIHEKKQS